MNTALNGKRVAVIGLGISNLSALHYLMRFDLKGITVFDTRQQPPRIAELPHGIELRLGPLSGEELGHFDLVVLGPGISAYNPEILKASAAGAEIVGDVELFAREVKVPVIGITGSNGKSTVTALTALMAQHAGLKAVAAANFGLPVFDALNDAIDMYVLELSSFELETTSSLHLKSATILNVSEDHLDRYGGSIEEYAKAKQRIFMNADFAVVNRDDPRTVPAGQSQIHSSSFGLNALGYGRIVENGGEIWLGVNGGKILNVRDMKICGVHNELNALACMALCDAAGIPKEAQIRALQEFPGLPHRCQLVAEINGVSFYNDSKATNVASAQAAIEGLAGRHPEGMLLLAGGLGKGQDFTPLKRYFGKEVSAAYCFGADAQKILDLDADRTFAVKDMEEGLLAAFRAARPGQAVLLSPACASFDQFKGFENRGEIFVDLVRKLKEA